MRGGGTFTLFILKVKLLLKEVWELTVIKVKDKNTKNTTSVYTVIPFKIHQNSYCSPKEQSPSRCQD